MAPADIGSVLALPVFAGLDEADAALFAEHGTAVDLPAGEVLFRQGERGSSLYFLLDGTLDVLGHDGENADYRLATLGPGAILGEGAVVTNVPRTATVLAVTDARLWQIDRESFHTALEASQRWSIALLRRIAGVLAERLSTVDRHLLSLIAQQQAGEPEPEAQPAGGRVAELERLRRRLMSDWAF